MQIAPILMVLLNVYVRRVLPVMAIHVAVRLTNLNFESQQNKEKAFFFVNHKNIVNVIPRVYNLLIIPRTRPQFQKLWCIIVYCFANRKISKTMNVINTIFLVSVRITNILVNKNYWSPSILHAVRHSAGMNALLKVAAVLLPWQQRLLLCNLGPLFAYKNIAKKE